MKTVINTLLTTTLILAAFMQLELTSQNNSPKKALDAFINATT